ncbi:uncharacterized protein METZ01_LOCUS259489, partial [marine metagenome]
PSPTPPRPQAGACTTRRPLRRKCAPSSPCATAPS